MTIGFVNVPYKLNLHTYFLSVKNILIMFVYLYKQTENFLGHFRACRYKCLSMF